MIIDQLHNASLYSSINSRIGNALSFLKGNPISEWPAGRYEIPISGMYLLIQQYNTYKQDKMFWEAHRDHIDVQYIIDGEETMGYAPVSELTVTGDFLDTKDVLVLEGNGKLFFTMQKGDFVVFYPQDAHMPCLTLREPEMVKKAVVKIRVD